jgi:hypothetical protein
MKERDGGRGGGRDEAPRNGGGGDRYDGPSRDV